MDVHTPSGRSPNPLSAGERRTKAFLREEGGPRSGGRSPRDLQFARILLSRALPQSFAMQNPAPSRREPFVSFQQHKHHQRKFLGGVCVFSAKNAETTGGYFFDGSSHCLKQPIRRANMSNLHAAFGPASGKQRLCLLGVTVVPHVLLLAADIIKMT